MTDQDWADYERVVRRGRRVKRGLDLFWALVAVGLLVWLVVDPW